MCVSIFVDECSSQTSLEKFLWVVGSSKCKHPQQIKVERIPVLRVLSRTWDIFHHFAPRLRDCHRKEDENTVRYGNCEGLKWNNVFCIWQDCHTHEMVTLSACIRSVHKSFSTCQHRGARSSWGPIPNWGPTGTWFFGRGRIEGESGFVYVCLFFY